MMAAVGSLKSPAGTPNYVAATYAEIARAKPAAVRLIGSMEMHATGAEGVRRLNRVMQLIEAIPLRMPELGRRPLAAKQLAICALFVETCLPSIVKPAQLAANRKMFLDILGAS